MDFGYKPALAVAVPPVNRIVQPPDEPTQFCHDAYGDTIDYVLTGVTVCGGCYTIAGQDYSFSLAGVNGSGSLTWTGTIWQVLLIGTLTVTRYLSGDGTCTGIDLVDIQTVNATILCTGDNQLFIDIVSVGATLDGQNLFNSQPVGLGTSANLRVAGDCGSAFVAGYDGSITISLP